MGKRERCRRAEGEREREREREREVEAGGVEGRRGRVTGMGGGWEGSLA